jgi:hypothetical protein
MTRPTLAELQQRIDRLEAEQAWFRRVLETYGIRGLWMSPAKAAPLLGVSMDKIKGEIHRAERKRALKQSCKLLYGVHYRNLQDEEAQDPTWQVHVAEFDRFLSIPPDER